MSRALVALVLAGLALEAGLAAAAGPTSATDEPGVIRLAQLHHLTPPGPREEDRPASAAPPAELDCRNCHQGSHHGVLQMYVGKGGRGAPAIPSHMAELRVECVACHVSPESGAQKAEIVGQTFRPSEKACLGCHNQGYRGMMQRWIDTLARMREILAPKLAATGEALARGEGRDPKRARARTLVTDAEANIEFVRLGRGVHNVFYAADLLKVANGWLDESLRLLEVTRPKADDALVRGGYCAVLCHDKAGVKVPATVSYEGKRVPHARHVTEFGATCTVCHSAEAHKAVTIKPAACMSCHHAPESDRCESCHRAQSAFYRGEARTPLVKLEPNVMVATVGCTGCHDLSRKHSARAVGQKCVDCHDKSYTSFAEEWTGGLAKEVGRATEEVRRAEAAVARARRAGHRSPEAEALVADARRAVDLVRQARGAHNPAGAESLLEVSRKKAAEALSAVRGR